MEQPWTLAGSQLNITLVHRQVDFSLQPVRFYVQYLRVYTPNRYLEICPA